MRWPSIWRTPTTARSSTDAWTGSVGDRQDSSRRQRRSGRVRGVRSVLARAHAQAQRGAEGERRALGDGAIRTLRRSRRSQGCFRYASASRVGARSRDRRSRCGLDEDRSAQDGKIASGVQAGTGQATETRTRRHASLRTAVAPVPGFLAEELVEAIMLNADGRVWIEKAVVGTITMSRKRGRARAAVRPTGRRCAPVRATDAYEDCVSPR